MTAARTLRAASASRPIRKAATLRHWLAIPAYDPAARTVHLLGGQAVCVMLSAPAVMAFGAILMAALP